ERDAGLRRRVHRRDRAADRHPRDAPLHRRVRADRGRHPRLPRLRRFDRRERLARRGAHQGRREVRVRAEGLAGLQPDPVSDHPAAAHREPVRRRALRVDVARRAVVGARVRSLLRDGPGRGHGGGPRARRRGDAPPGRRRGAAAAARARWRFPRPGARGRPTIRGRVIVKRKLRSNLEPGTAMWAGRRAQWRALGLTDEDMEKPKIAVVNSSSELSSCFSHLDGVSAEVKAAIRAAGGLPFEVRTAAPSDFVTSAGRRGAYILPSRDLIAADIEVQVEGALLDGMVCLASCDKTTPGQLMAAGRLDIPTIVVVCGYQKSGEYKGRHVDIEEVFLKSGYLASGGITLEDLTGMANVAVQ